MSIITMSGGGRSGLRGVKAVVAEAASYPNEPAGMSLITQFEGDSLDPSTGLSDWGSWFDEPDITVVADGTSPGPTGSVMEFNYDVGDQSAGRRIANTWAGGPYDEVYFMFRVKQVSPWDTDAASKLFFWGAVEGSRNNNESIPTQYFLTYEADDKMLVASQNSAPITHNMLFLTGFWSGEVGNWVEIEMHCVSESSPGAADGSIFLYKNGTLVDSNEGTEQWVASDDPAVGFTGMQWYNKSGYVATVARNLRVAELYVSGK